MIICIIQQIIHFQLLIIVKKSGIPNSPSFCSTENVAVTWRRRAANVCPWAKGSITSTSTTWKEYTRVYPSILIWTTGAIQTSSRPPIIRSRLKAPRPATATAPARAATRWSTGPIWVPATIPFTTRTTSFCIIYTWSAYSGWKIPIDSPEWVTWVHVVRMIVCAVGHVENRLWCFLDQTY